MSSKVFRAIGAVMTVAGVIMYERGYNKYQVQGRADMKLKTLGNDAGTLYGICGKEDEDLNMIASVDFKDKYSSNLKYNFFNIENPKEYLKGSDAIAVEKGPYMFKKHSIKYGVGFKTSALTESTTPLADGAIEYNDADMYIPLDKKMDVTSTEITRDASDLSLSWSSSKRNAVASYEKMMSSHLSMKDKITNLSPIYQSLLGEVNDEFTLVLSLVCTPKQIENILSANTKAQCLLSELNDMEEDDCSCCMLRDMYVSEGEPAGVQVCDDHLIESGDIMSELSLLAYYDSGVVVKDAGEKMYSGTSAFGETAHKQTKIYSPVIQSHTVDEILFGHPSAYMGKVIPQVYFAEAHKAMKDNGINDVKETATELLTGGMDGTLPIELGDIASYTKKVGSVCSSTCKDSATVNSRLDYTCEGFAPERHELSNVDDILLGGIDCKPYTATYSTAKMCKSIDDALLLDPAAPMETCVCADGSDDYKTTGCCLASGNFEGLDLTAHGCLYPVEGVLGSNYVGKYSGPSSAKPTVDIGEASEALIGSESSQTASKKTVQFMCPDKATGESLTIPEQKFFGRIEGFEGSDSHVTFHSTGNDRMRQNDGAETGKVSYSQEVNAFSTRYFPAKGYDGYFSHTSLTKGHTFKENFDIYMKDTKTPVAFKEDWGSKPYVCDDELCHMGSRLKPLADAFIGTNVTNLRGIGMPFDGVQAIGVIQGPSSKGRPTYFHNPFYIHGDSALLSQQNNEHVDAEAGNGLKIYRVIDQISDPGSFSTGSANYQLVENTTQQLIIEGNQDQNEYESYIDLEPATGLGIRSRIRFGVSHSIWECDPVTNDHCKLARFADDSGKCYDSATFSYPCSASNILSPEVVGGKIIPTYWFEDFKETVDNVDIGILTELALEVKSLHDTYNFLVFYGINMAFIIGFPLMIMYGIFASKREYLNHGAVGAGGKKPQFSSVVSSQSSVQKSSVE